jgi:FKBP-type peptidyl-prolyl cis-trans isomerase 2
MTKVEKGNTVSVHYCGTFSDGTEFDNSKNREEPMTFTVGAGQMISGFESALDGMEVGETKSVSLSPDEAYGNVNKEWVQPVPRSNFPADFDLIDGATVQGQRPDGQMFVAKIVSHDDDTAILDFNHPLAGRNLNFSIELINIG